MSSSTQNSELANIKSRSTWIRKENNWKYNNVSMVQKWKVLKVSNLVQMAVKINDIMVYPSNITDNHFEFDFSDLRKKWFELLGETTRECDLLALEDACMYAQLQSLHFYAKTPKQILQSSIFTDGMTILFVPEWKPRTNNNPTKLEILEDYIVSDVHKDVYQETL
jgi:hypothetical protein